VANSRPAADPSASAAAFSPKTLGSVSSLSPFVAPFVSRGHPKQERWKDGSLLSASPDCSFTAKNLGVSFRDALLSPCELTPTAASAVAGTAAAALAALPAPRSLKLVVDATSAVAGTAAAASLVLPAPRSLKATISRGRLAGVQGGVGVADSGIQKVPAATTQGGASPASDADGP
jgi:hypothetical protein